MPFRNLNEMDTHDGTNQRIDFGGPYAIRIMLNGADLYRGEVGKADRLHISMVPMGDSDVTSEESDRGTDRSVPVSVVEEAITDIELSLRGGCKPEPIQDAVDRLREEASE